MDRAFKRLPQSPTLTVLGLELRALTLGHYFLLSDTENAYAEDPDKADESDLLAAIWICAQPHDQARRAVGTIRTTLFFKMWGWFLKSKPIGFEKLRFDGWFDASMDCPAMEFVGGGETFEASTPLQWRLLAMLMNDFHMTRAQALEVPMQDIHCLWAAEMERRGLARGKALARSSQELWDYAREQERLAASN